MKKFEWNVFLKWLWTPDCYKWTIYDIADNWYWVKWSKDTSLPNFLPCHVFWEKFETNE
jgi:hypothetical protein